MRVCFCWNDTKDDNDALRHTNLQQPDRFIFEPAKTKQRQTVIYSVHLVATINQKGPYKTSLVELRVDVRLHILCLRLSVLQNFHFNHIVRV